jgi:3-phenylpropionate/cinnamic acid dioxygenase small subunit
MTTTTRSDQPIALDPNQARDELTIRNILALLAQRHDDGSLDAYGELYSQDARWEMPAIPLVRQGREEIVADSADWRSAGISGPGSQTRHVVSTVVVTLDGDLAVAESYWQLYVDTETNPTLRSMGKYRDTFRRTGEGWHLWHRQVIAG